MTNNIVPFGKYKGQPIEALREDKEYLDWLMAQPWFRTRHEGLFTIIVNNFGEAASTPEHNALQALFLSPTYAEGLFDLVHPGRRSLSPEYLTGSVKVAPRPVVVQFEVRGADVCLSLSMYDDVQIRVEVKPTVGDDYPAVMRQMKANKCDVLFLEHYTGIGANEDQFVAMFKASRIQVVFRHELEFKTAP